EFRRVLFRSRLSLIYDSKKRVAPRKLKPFRPLSLVIKGWKGFFNFKIFSENERSLFYVARYKFTANTGTFTNSTKCRAGNESTNDRTKGAGNRSTIKTD